MTYSLFRKAGDGVKKGIKTGGISEEALAAEYEAVYRYVLSLCRNNFTAQDITQETFLKAMRSASQFQGNSSLYTWLCAIAKNHWLNLCKADGKELPLFDSAGLEAEHGDSIEDRLVEKDTALQIHEILHNLPEPYKEVFSLRVFGQLSFFEIARLFGKTESWARVTHHRARKMIHEKIRKGDLNG